MAALRAALPLTAALACGLAGCYTHYPYGSDSYGPWTPAYSTPGPAVIGPGVESLGAPSTSPGGNYQAPIYQQPSSSREGDYYGQEDQQSRKLVPPYYDVNGPGASSDDTTYGPEHQTPFGP